MQPEFKMQPSIHELSLKLNEGADTIKMAFATDANEASKFLEVCEEFGFMVKVTDKKINEEVNWRHCPDTVIKQLAIEMFDLYRKRLMN